MAEVTSYMGDHDRKLEMAIKMALRLVGGQGERAAKETISDMGAVDTGFLRNSITYAIAGQSPNASEYEDDDGKQRGTYEGEAPDDDGEALSVYIGTNVFYGPYVEYGTTKMDARPFLSTAIQTNIENFKDLFEQAFKHYMY